MRAESMMHLALRQPLRAHVQRASMRHHRDRLIGLGCTYWRFEVYRASDVPQRASEITQPRGRSRRNLAHIAREEPRELRRDQPRYRLSLWTGGLKEPARTRGGRTSTAMWALDPLVGSLRTDRGEARFSTFSSRFSSARPSLVCRQFRAYSTAR